MKWVAKFDHNDELHIFSNEDTWHDTPEQAIEEHIEKLKAELPKWYQEVISAIQKNDLYRGGGILALANLMKRLSCAKGRLAAQRSFSKK